MASMISVVPSLASRPSETWWAGLVQVLDSIEGLEGFEHGNIVYNVALANQACASVVTEIDPIDFL
jgi:hypothetical protein